MTTFKLIIFFIALFFAEMVLAKAVISFDREIEISERANVNWSDIVSVQGGDEALLRELAHIPWQGGGADEIRRTLRESRPFGGEVQMVIPQEIRLRKVAGYSKAEFRRKLTNTMSARCTECRFEIRAVRDESVKLSSNWDLDASAVKATGSLLVPVLSEGATVWIPVQAKVFRSAMVLKRSVALGQIITADDVETRETDVSFSKETPMLVGELQGMTAARTLGAGQAIFASDLKKQDAVKRGQAIKMMTGTDDFEVMVSVMAEENGRVGDTVKVKSPDTGKSFSALVTAQGLVRLQ